MPVARAFREAKDAQPHGDDGVAKETGSLVKNVSTRWNSNIAMFRYTGLSELELHSCDSVCTYDNIIFISTVNYILWYLFKYFMLLTYCRSFTKNKDAVTALLHRARELDLPPLPASLGNRANFWNILDGLVKVLTPFEDATLQVSKEDSSLGECIPYAQTLVSNS